MARKVQTQTAQGTATASASVQDEIARVAYELFEQRGRLPGHEQEDWLKAEQIVQQRRRLRGRA